MIMNLIDPQARLADDVVVGPYCCVTGPVNIGPGCRLISHVVIMGRTTIGQGNTFWPHCVIGGDPQARQRGDGLGVGRPGSLHQRRGLQRMIALKLAYHLAGLPVGQPLAGGQTAEVEHGARCCRGDQPGDGRPPPGPLSCLPETMSNLTTP